MPYTKLTSYQFRRGRGFTEESVLAFRSLALAAIDELARSDRSAIATFPLSSDEVQLVLHHRASGAEVTLVAPEPVAPEPIVPDAVVPEPVVPEAEVPEPMSSYLSNEVSSPLTPDSAETAEAPADVGSPPDNDFAAAARWLALATRNETEPYEPSLVRQRE